MRIVIPSIRTEKMTLVAEEQTVKIKGRLDVQFPKQTLGLFLNNLHKEVCKKNGDMIYLDITELSYVNSASIREFLSWLLFVLKLNKKDHIKNKITGWQKVPEKINLPEQCRKLF